jgi:hypothetical protein
MHLAKKKGCNEAKKEHRNGLHYTSESVVWGLAPWNAPDLREPGALSREMLLLTLLVLGPRRVPWICSDKQAPAWPLSTLTLPNAFVPWYRTRREKHLVRKVLVHVE